MQSAMEKAERNPEWFGHFPEERRERTDEALSGRYGEQIAGNPV